MKAPRIALAVVAAALAFPAALAAAPPALADTTIPTVTVDTSGVPSTCSDPNAIVCGGIGSVPVHTGVYTGTYFPSAGITSFSTTCEVGNSSGPQVCTFTFTNGIPGTLCDPNPMDPATPAVKPWSTNWSFQIGDKSTGGDALYAEGGGALDFVGADFGTPVVTHVHLQIASVCGNENTLQGLTDGGVNLSGAEPFSGYIDIN